MFRLFTDFEWVRAVWGVCTWTALIMAGVLLSLYQHKYLPAIDRTKSDLQTSMIKDLQRQVNILIQKSDDQTE